MDQPEMLEIALCLVSREGRWLVALRHVDSHVGGLWEFPGGKLIAGESPSDAALRELREECDVEAEVICVSPSMEHSYGDVHLRFIPVLCRYVNGEARALASQTCRWVTAAELSELPMPAANSALVQRIKDCGV